MVFSFFLGKALSIVTNCCSLFFCPWYDPFFRAGCQLGTERRRRTEEEKEENRETSRWGEEREGERGAKRKKEKSGYFLALQVIQVMLAKCASFLPISLILVVQLLKIYCTSASVSQIFGQLFAICTGAKFLRKWGQWEPLNPSSILKLLNTGWKKWWMFFGRTFTVYTHTT